ncbi:MAG: hypothetical protein R3253_13190 [Longimicrobiales bacterium]|nr:hypothetical protein [Longimicrobiales bacterium]
MAVEKPVAMPFAAYLQDRASRSMTRDNLIIVGVIGAYVAGLFFNPAAAEALRELAVAAFGAAVGQAFRQQPKA